MLFLQGADPVRVQCAFIDTPEVAEITKFIAKQQGYPTAFYLPEYVSEDGGGDLEMWIWDVWIRCSKMLPV